MGVDYAFQFEDLPPAISDEIPSDAEVAAYYAATTTPGAAPPLEAIFEHVKRALMMSRAMPPPDPVKSLISKWTDYFGRMAVWFDTDIEAAIKRAGVRDILEFQPETDEDGNPLEVPVLQERWFAAAEGLATLEVMRDALARTNKVEAQECVALLVEAFTLAAVTNRRFRFLVLA